MTGEAITPNGGGGRSDPVDCDRAARALGRLLLGGSTSAPFPPIAVAFMSRRAGCSLAQGRATRALSKHLAVSGCRRCFASPRSTAAHAAPASRFIASRPPGRCSSLASALRRLVVVHLGRDATTRADACSVGRATARRACRTWADRAAGKRLCECRSAWLSGSPGAAGSDAAAAAQTSSGARPAHSRSKQQPRR